jgi:hypothetical protein
MANEGTIWVVTDDTPEQPTGNNRGKNYREVPSESFVERGTKVSVQKLEQEMASFVSVVSRLFNRAEQQADKQSGMRLDEIEISVEISGEGEVKLVGTGAKAAGKGAITLKFKRTELE